MTHEPDFVSGDVYGDDDGVFAFELPTERNSCLLSLAIREVAGGAITEGAAIRIDFVTHYC